MVDELGLAWSGGSHCEFPVVAESIDKGRFAYVRSAYEGKLRQFLGWLSSHPNAASGKYGFADFHR